MNITIRNAKYFFCKDYDAYKSLYHCYNRGDRFLMSEEDFKKGKELKEEMFADWSYEEIIAKLKDEYIAYLNLNDKVEILKRIEKLDNRKARKLAKWLSKVEL